MIAVSGISAAPGALVVAYGDDRKGHIMVVDIDKFDFLKLDILAGILYLLSGSTPIILRLPRSQYARQYLLGCQATIGQGPAVLTV